MPPTYDVCCTVLILETYNLICARGMVNVRSRYTVVVTVYNLTRCQARVKGRGANVAVDNAQIGRQIEEGR